MADGLSLKDLDDEKRQFSSRVWFLFLLILLMSAGLVARFVQLQVYQYETYTLRSEKNRIQVQPLAPPRGLIFDRDGEVLGSNRPASSLGLVVERVPDLDAALSDLRHWVKLTDADIETFRSKVAAERRPGAAIILRENLSEAEVAKLAVNRFKLAGIEVNTELVRYYPQGEIAAHAVGSVRRIDAGDLAVLDPVSYSGTRFLGKRGVEQHYEAELHGEVGYQQVEIDAHGRIRGVLKIEPPISGQNLTLHLDINLQRVAEAAMQDHRGAVVALDPRTGGVLAMVSMPSYDPNIFIRGMSDQSFARISGSIYTPLFNRAVNGQYAPGSTVKPMMGLAGITHDLIQWDTMIDDRGEFKLPGQKRAYRDWSWTKDNSGGQGMVDLYRAIYRSSNVYFYDMASRASASQLTDFVGQFGLGRARSVDISEASSGLLPTAEWKNAVRGEPWYPGDNLNFSIGQGDLLATPLQMAVVAATFANRGLPVVPRMVNSVDGVAVSSAMSVEPIFGPTVADWEQMVAAMSAVVHRGNKGFRGNGTAWAYIGQDIGYLMAGKSGTAQVVEIRQGEEYDEEELSEFSRKHAWFIAFAPVQAPTIALAVLLENGGGGSSVAAPVARTIIDAHMQSELASR